MRGQEVQDRLLSDLDLLHLADVVQIKQFIHDYIGSRLKSNIYESVRSEEDVLEKKEIS